MKKLTSRFLAILALCSISLSASKAADEKPKTYDVVVYGGTPAGIAAAVQAARMKKSVILIEPGAWLGGMISGGLGATDKGIVWTVGGVARDFFQRVYKHYEDPAAWKFETRANYVPKHGQILTEAMKCQWYFEPKAATQIFNEMLKEAAVPVVMNQRIDRKDGVKKVDGEIREIKMENGDKYAGRYFIDASYEGDLMAAAGVAFTVGREPIDRFNESMNGVRVAYKLPLAGISPYIEADRPESGLLPRVEPKPPGLPGAGDHRTQAYNFRMTLTNVPENRVPFEKPADYNPLQYEILLRMLVKKGRPIVPFKLTPMPNGKTDSNNAIYISTDFTGGSYDWPEASHAEREKILAAHRSYIQGFFWFLQNDPRVPAGVREKVAPYGLCKDEFVDNGHWPTQLYVREARRMVGEHVMKQDNFSAKQSGKNQKAKHPLPEVPKEPITDPVAVGSYALDSHMVTMFVDEDGVLCLEGNYSGGPRPYGISYRSLLPKADQCKNLLVPICLSSSHVAYGSIRMEPVYMELGQAAATAACLALDQKTTLHKLPYDDLRKQLLADHAVLSPEVPTKAEMLEETKSITEDN